MGVESGGFHDSCKAEGDGQECRETSVLPVILCWQMLMFTSLLRQRFEPHGRHLELRPLSADGREIFS